MSFCHLREARKRVLDAAIRAAQLRAARVGPRVLAAFQHLLATVQGRTGLRDYFRNEAHLDLEVVLFLSYEAQVKALLGSKIDIGWNTNLAYVQAQHRSEGRREG